MATTGKLGEHGKVRRHMGTVRYKCCNHCEGPCPLDGHSEKCPDCRTSANGRRVFKAETRQRQHQRHLRAV